MMRPLSVHPRLQNGCIFQSINRLIVHWERFLRGTVHLIGDDVATSSVLQRGLAADYRVLIYSSARRLLERLPHERGPGCVILDVASPGLAGPQLRAAMAKSGSTLPIMFLTNSAKDWKRGPPTEFRRLLRQIKNAMRVQEKEEARGIVTLTLGQKKLLRRFAKGNTDRQIAQELGVKESLIADQRCEVMRRLQIASQAQLVIMTDRLAIWPNKNKGAAAPLPGSPPQQAAQY